MTERPRTVPTSPRSPSWLLGPQVESHWGASWVASVVAGVPAPCVSHGVVG